MLSLLAPAKLNLVLEVLRERPDGYHEIRSIMQAISLCDTLHFTPADSVSFRCDRAGWSAELSLVSSAVNLLRETTGCRLGVRIELEKRIPLLSGLGGDSSDAAAVLRGLNLLWELDLPIEKLIALAARLGSDLPFFLYGGTALAEGRGELITPLPPLKNTWFLIFVPGIKPTPQKTARLYRCLNQDHFTDGACYKRSSEFLRRRKGPAELYLCNTFENIAFDFWPALNIYRNHLLKLGADNVHLAGSGPALFSMITDEAAARDLYRRSCDQGLEAYLAEALGPTPGLDSSSCG